MKKKNLIVLDIDDTLTSSGNKHNDALIFGMEHFGITAIDTDWRNYKNATDSYVFSVNYEKSLKKPFSFDLIEELEEVMLNRFLESKPTTQLQGADQALNFFINETNYGICFATGSIHKLALAKLQQANINFDPAVLSSSNAIFTREGIIEASIAKAKKVYNVTSFEHIISFGDGLWDFKTAANLGVHFVGVNDKNLEDFRKMGVKYHISDWTTFNLKEAEQILQIDNER